MNDFESKDCSGNVFVHAVRQSVESDNFSVKSLGTERITAMPSAFPYSHLWEMNIEIAETLVLVLLKTAGLVSGLNHISNLDHGVED